jgi:hypothetical protein
LDCTWRAARFTGETGRRFDARERFADGDAPASESFAKSARLDGPRDERALPGFKFGSGFVRATGDGVDTGADGGVGWKRNGQRYQNSSDGRE